MSEHALLYEVELFEHAMSTPITIESRVQISKTTMNEDEE